MPIKATWNRLSPYKCFTRPTKEVSCGASCRPEAYLCASVDSYCRPPLSLEEESCSFFEDMMGVQGRASVLEDNTLSATHNGLVLVCVCVSLSFLSYHGKQPRTTLATDFRPWTDVVRRRRTGQFGAGRMTFFFVSDSVEEKVGGRPASHESGGMVQELFTTRMVDT